MLFYFCFVTFPDWLGTVLKGQTFLTVENVRKPERKAEPNNNDINGFHCTAADFFICYVNLNWLKTDLHREIWRKSKQI